jgi:hypothetical protein
MYKVAYITGSASTINPLLEKAIEQINRSGGQITNVVQSQSSIETFNYTVVTITIIYQMPRPSSPSLF